MRKLLAMTMLIASGVVGADDATIEKKLENLGIENISISDSPLTGLRTVISDQGIFYASEDGKYLLQGALVEVGDDGVKDLTNQPLMEKLNAASKDMIIYPAKEEKHVVTVFTDITCPYCTKLHREIEQYNAHGITVRYLAFPRAGDDSKAARQMASIWQAKDRNAALDAAELDKKTPEEAKDTDLIRAQFILGHQFGVSGTPAMILENGQMIPGYRKASELLKIIEQVQ